MKRILCVLLGLLSVGSLASPPITEQVLTRENVRKLGFSVTVEVSPEATSVKIVGPKSINGNCYPGRSGNALMDKAGNELTTYVTQLTSSQVAPVAFGYYTSNETNMSVWLDYFCPPDQAKNSRRFVVPSVAEYLITSLGSGQ
ncbi:hypothetical protein ACCI51_18985 [Microbulbifer echini]|uniref:Uncharacterized protein n=1 Tax=Microbulbifer echini TaxID=1529067 RepID=A0ABV4NTU9_9GAMM